MILFATLLTAAGLAQASKADVVPSFDTFSYCRGVEQSTDKRVQTVFLACKVREDGIKPQIDEYWRALTDNQKDECLETALFGGGSYMVLYICTTITLGIYGLNEDGGDPVDKFNRDRKSD